MTKFLVVDDDEDLGAIMEEKLKPLGVCHVCTSGHEAIAVLGSESFDVVVTDYIMQGGDGASLAHYCANHKIPVLVVSSYPETQIRPYLPSGATFLNKFTAVRGNLLEDTIRAILPVEMSKLK